MRHPFLPTMERALVLASQSPRRRHLLEAQGLAFTVHPAHIDETLLEGEVPKAHAERLALEKAKAVAIEYPGAAVLGSDTIVVIDGEILGKPAEARQAERMLARLSGHWHEVISSVALVCEQTGHASVCSESTRVRFRSLEPDEIERYVASGEPLDKAGAYGIQALGALLVERIEGCYFNVMGLPLQGLRRLMIEFSAADDGAITEGTGGR